MKKFVVLGAPGSGRKSLIAAVKKDAPQLKLELYAGRIPAQVEGAVLVVSSADGPMPETLEQLKAAFDAGVRRVVCCLSRTDEVDDPNLLELVEMECRELASSVGYSDEVFEVARVSVRAGHGVAELVSRLGARSAAAPPPGSLPDGQIKCRKCPYSQPMPFDSCPSCGEGQPRSFWSRLFG